MSERAGLLLGVVLLVGALSAALLSPPREEVRALRAVLAKAPQDALVIVDDSVGEHLGEHLDRPGPVFLPVRDVNRYVQKKEALPCTGPVLVLTRTPDKLHPKLRGMPSTGAPAPIEGTGFFLVALAR